MINRSAFRATNRFGMGANKKDIDAIGLASLDWVRTQMRGSASVAIAGVPASASALEGIQEFRQQQKARRKAGVAPIKLREFDQAHRKRLHTALAAQLDHRFNHSVTTELPVKERLALFWSNHFTVSQAGKPQVIPVCVAYENEAIRPNLDKHFSDMLVAVVTHPAMLLYLDNAQSIGPDSTAGKRRHLGLNENLARELMELHTLGVDGGYNQADVTNLAKILTGWTIGSPRLARQGAKTGEFAFVEAMHQPGPIPLLGTTYRQKGQRQGLEAIADLAHHPATAHHIATQLVRHLVADQPAPRDVEIISNVFMKTGGHLPSVHEALANLPGAWDPANRKLKTPLELIVSVWRGLELPPELGNPTAILRTMGNAPFSAPSPAGWPDTAEAWGAPAAIQARVDWGIAAGRRIGNRIDAQAAAHWLVEPSQSPGLVTALAHAESPTQAMSLLLASPDLQWR